MKKITLHLALAVIVSAGGFSSCSNDTEDSLVLPEPQPVSIQWNGLTVNLQTDNNWCMARSNKWVAFTNYDQKTQYHISWGENSPMLRIVENGKSPSVCNIKKIDFKNDGVNSTITFIDENNNTGIIVYPVWEE